MARAPELDPLREPLVDAPSSPGMAPIALGELLDAVGLEDTLASFHALFRIPIRVLNPDGSSVQRSRASSELNDYLAQLPRASRLLAELHASLTRVEPGESGELLHTAFTGATYHVGAIGHDGRRIGRFVIGPFITPEVERAPETLLGCDPDIDAERAEKLLLALPRVRQDTVRNIARHLAVTLDVLIFASHKALLVEHMHLSALQESSRELAEQREREREAEERLARLELSQFRWLEGVAGEIEAERARGDWERLGALSALLADLGRAERGALELRRDAIELPALLEHVRSRLSPEVLALLEVRATADLAERQLFGDVARLAQALAALIVNAAEAGGGERVELTIRDRRVRDDGEGIVFFGAPSSTFELELSVADCGPPLGAADRALLFDPFRREASRSDGACEGRRGSLAAALRLALAQKLVRAQSGSLRVEEGAPRGAVFVLALPLSVAASG